jgi:hypothetical protein
VTSPQYLTACEIRLIDCAHGAVEYLFVDFQDDNHQDITADPVSIALGTYDTPGAWHPADVVQQNGAVWKIRAGLLIGAALTYPPGIYWAWVRLIDSPETLPRRIDTMFVQIT